MIAVYGGQFQKIELLEKRLPGGCFGTNFLVCQAFTELVQ